MRKFSRTGSDLSGGIGRFCKAFVVGERWIGLSKHEFGNSDRIYQRSQSYRVSRDSARAGLSMGGKRGLEESELPAGLNAHVGSGM